MLIFINILLIIPFPSPVLTSIGNKRNNISYNKKDTNLNRCRGSSNNSKDILLNFTNLADFTKPNTQLLSAL
jgi:hypothetical protein